MLFSQILLSLAPCVLSPSMEIEQPVLGPAVAPVTVTQGEGERGLFDTNLWFAFPDSGEAFSLTVLVGTNFGDFPIPYFGLTPSVPIFTLNLPEIPLIGTISGTITAVPIYIFSGTVDLTIDGERGRSNAIPFTLL
ncbi:MAG: hypothetical protein DWQ01_17110 [Planctomycetota bacterium]|nr:MAG: hypothetical protein DWQ01_17110 [Planctomycetota bacterium]